MMDDTPDYASYSLAQLEDVRQHVNREKFPDRYAMVVAEIEKRREAGVEGKDDLSSEKLRHNQRVYRGSAFLLIIGAFVFVFGVIAPLVSTYESREWKKTPCVLGHVSDQSGKEKIVFTYVVAGQTYSNDLLHSARTNSRGYGGKHPLRDYPPGKKTFCFVNPLDPSQAVLKWGWDIWGAIFGLGWCGFAVWFGVRGLKHPEEVKIRGAKNPYDADN